MEWRRTTVAGFRVYSVHAGAGPAVTLLHGLSGSHRWWLNTIPALATTFSVNVPELIGFGGSRHPARQPGIAEMADVLRLWLDAVGIPKTHLVGHSMGGQVSIHLAVREPARVRRLVLVSAAGVPRPLTVRELRRFVTEVAAPRAWVRPRRFAGTIVLDAVRAGPRALVTATRDILLDDVRPLLPHISQPTRLLWGAVDPLTPLEQGREMAAAIPGSRLIVFPHAAHIPMVECPDAFNAELHAFLGSP